jgi:hypothetical protein
VKVGWAAELEGFYLDGVVAFEDLLGLWRQRSGGGLDPGKGRLGQAIVEARHLGAADGETPGSQQQGQPALPGHATVGAVVFAREQGHRLPEEDAPDPTGWRQHAGIGGHLVIEAVDHDVEELHEASARDVVESGLAAQVGQGQALPQPPLHAIVAVVQNRQHGVHKAEQIRPVDALPLLQRRGRQTALAGLQVDSFSPRQLRGKLPQRLLVLGHGPPFVGRRRRTGETHADAPMVAGRHQQEGKEPAWERFGRVAESLVNTATSLLSQENAAAVAAVRQMIAPRPPGTALAEDGQVADLGILVPALGLDLATLLIGDRDQVLFAASTADVTIPVLDDRQMTHRQRHGNPGN